MVTPRFNPPPNWPEPPPGWMPPPGWQPDPSWPAPPEGWQLWVEGKPDAATRLKQWGGKAVATAQDAAAKRSDKANAADEVAAPNPAPDPNVLWEGKGLPMAAVGGGRYRLTRTHLYFEKGLLSTNAQQVPIADVADVDLRQSMTQKARGLGDVLVHVQRTHGAKEVAVISDIPNPRHVQQLINQVSSEARAALQRARNTHYTHGNFTAPTAPPTQQPAGPPAPGPDLMEQLERLGRLRDAGVLTEEEFQTKKADLLSRL